MGVIIKGLFVALSPYPRKDGSTAHAVTVATGTDAYQIFVDDETASLLTSMKIGDPIELSARPYVNSRGRLSWAGASLA